MTDRQPKKSDNSLPHWLTDVPTWMKTTVVTGAQSWALSYSQYWLRPSVCKDGKNSKRTSPNQARCRSSRAESFLRVYLFWYWWWWQNSCCQNPRIAIPTDVQVKLEKNQSTHKKAQRSPGFFVCYFKCYWPGITARLSRKHRTWQKSELTQPQL